MASLDEQTDKDFDLVIVNDASPDDVTNAECVRLRERPRTRVIHRERNGGTSAARNDGFAAAHGEVVVMLDADDTLPPETVERVKASFNPDVDFLVVDYAVVSPDGQTRQVMSMKPMADEDGSISPQRVARSPWIIHGSSPCRVSTWKSVGGFRQEYSYTFEDVDFWLRVMTSGAQGRHVPFVLYEWHRAPTGKNARVQGADLWRIYRDNVAFFDKHGDGQEFRRRIVRNLWASGAIQEARDAAAQLLAHVPTRHAPEALLRHVPLPVSSALRLAARTAYRALKPGGGHGRL